MPPDYLMVSREINGKVDIPYKRKKSRGKFSSGKNVVTSKKLVTFPRLIFQIRHFPPTNFYNQKDFLEWDWFFPEKSCSLTLGFFKLIVEECTLVVTNPWNWLLQTHPFVDITKQKVLVQDSFP